MITIDINGETVSFEIRDRGKVVGYIHWSDVTNMEDMKRQYEAALILANMASHLDKLRSMAMNATRERQDQIGRDFVQGLISPPGVYTSNESTAQCIGTRVPACLEAYRKKLEELKDGSEPSMADIAHAFAANGID